MDIMKKALVSLIILCTYAMAVYAQDVIVKKDGSTILSKILEVNPNDVKYKKFSNPNGPTYTIIKSEIMSINYENGDWTRDASGQSCRFATQSAKHTQPLFRKRIQKMFSDIV